MAIDVYSETGELVAATMPAGSRRLGVRVKPILRLAMGHKDPQKGHPVKDDHFTPRGDDRAVAKFMGEYGDKPRSVEILLPSELDQALAIRYMAFKAAAGQEGGTLVAIGETNFAHRDYCGGIDTITVFNQDGTVETIESGIDVDTGEFLDARAKQLGLALYTTLTATMPGVLGFGSYFALSTKGKESTDNLWRKLRELYGLFGSKITFAVKPHLVIRPSTARPVVTKGGETKRITTTIYVADIVVPETIDEMIDRLRDRQAAIAPAGAAAALYGARGELPASPDGGGNGGGRDVSSGVAAVPAAAEVVEDGDWTESEGPTPEQVAAADIAALVKPGGGPYRGRTFEEIAALDDGPAWFATQLRAARIPARVRQQLSDFCLVRLPEVWAAFVAQQELAA